MRYRVKYCTKMMLPGLLLAVLALVGCAAPYTYYCDDGCGPQSLSGRWGGCGTTPCGTAGCDAAPCGTADCSTAPCGTVPCGTAACAPCGGTDADPFCGLTLTGLLRSMVTCNAGCGDIYWGEWCYDPPDECDACNNHGDWIGPRCCPPSCWTRLWEGLHGARFCEATCEPACGCGTCDGPGATLLEGEPIESMDEFETMEPVPVPAPQPTVARANPRASVPSYSRNPNSRLVRRPAQ